MKKIKLTTGEYALIDDEDFHHLNQKKWRFNDRRNVGKSGYVERVTRKNGKILHFSIHRVILNPQKGFQIDHIDRNTLNNQKSNLRVVTQSQNQHNRGKQKNNTSGFKGVFWKKKIRKWRAQINVDKKCIHIGYFADKIKAARAYNKVSVEHFGRFAQLNQIK